MRRTLLAALLAFGGVALLLGMLEHQNRTVEQARRAPAGSATGRGSSSGAGRGPGSEQAGGASVRPAPQRVCAGAADPPTIRLAPVEALGSAQTVDLGGDGSPELVVGWQQAAGSSPEPPEAWLVVLQQPTAAAPGAWGQLLRHRVEDYLLGLQPHLLRLSTGATLLFFDAQAGANSVSTGFVSQTEDGRPLLGDLGGLCLQALVDLDDDGRDEVLTSSGASYGNRWDTLGAADALRWSDGGLRSLLTTPTFELHPLPTCGTRGVLLLALRREDPDAGGQDSLAVLRWSPADQRLRTVTVLPVGELQVDSQGSDGRVVRFDDRAAQALARPLALTVGDRRLLLDSEDRLAVAPARRRRH